MFFDNFDMFDIKNVFSSKKQPLPYHYTPFQCMFMIEVW